jgi:hypothetical protein
LIIKNFSSSPSSFESFVVICSLAHMCLGDLLDKARGHLTSYNLSLNFELLTPNVETFYILMGTTYSGICWFVLGKKCCIKILMTNVEWQISFFRSILIVPIIILVWEVFYFINSFCNCLNKSVFLIYCLSFHSCHDWYGIIPLVNDVNECRENNIIRFLHLTNTPLFCIHIHSL